MAQTNNILLSDHFTYRRLLRFTAPTMLMLLFASFYVVVDGLFVANCAGKSAFAAVNLIWPFPMIIGALGYMFGSGGCALVSKTLGKGNAEKARGYFTAIVIVAFLSGIVLSATGYIYIENVARLLGATEQDLLPDCLTYGRIIMLSMPFFILQTLFQPFMIAAERPTWGLSITLMAGVVNILLDALFIYWLKMGVEGAAIATLISQTIGALLPLLFFVVRQPSNLYVSRPRLNWQTLKQVIYNGSSEFIVNASMPMVNLLYVAVLWRVAGENGVGAWGVIMYVNVIFFSVFSGFSMGSAPLVSYHYGANRLSEVRNIRKRSLLFLLIAAILMCAFAEALAPLLALAFAHGDALFRSSIYEAFALYAISFLITPFNIYASSFFTALNNGRVSAIISFSRVLLFQVGAVLLLSYIWGVQGIWLSTPLAELASLIITIYFYYSQKKQYNY